MHWKETGGVEKLFALPGRSLPAKRLSRLHSRHLTAQYADIEDFGNSFDWSSILTNRFIMYQEFQTWMNLLCLRHTLGYLRYSLGMHYGVLGIPAYKGRVGIACENPAIKKTN